MKIIGIMGNSGSGKTTFSNALSSKESVGVIHVDDLVAKAKRKYFRIFLQPKENNSTEQTKNNPKLKAGAKKFFYRNKLTFNFLMKLRSMLVMPEIESQLNAFKEEGKELVLVDDWVLLTHKNLLKRLNHIYVLERKYLDRRKGFQERDALSREELNVADLPYALGLLKKPEGANVTTITNYGSIDELETKALEVYSKYVEPTFDEKYKLEPKEIILSTITKAMNKTKNYSKSSISKDSK